MSRSFTTYESNVLFALRFMIDHEVVGGNWVELPAGQHTYQGPGNSNTLSHCQMEAHIHCSKVISHKPEGRLGHKLASGLCLPHLTLAILCCIVFCLLKLAGMPTMPRTLPSLVCALLATCLCSTRKGRRQQQLVMLAGEWQRLAPFRILSVDIECAGRKVTTLVYCCPGCNVLTQLVADTDDR